MSVTHTRIQEIIEHVRTALADGTYDPQRTALAIFGTVSPITIDAVRWAMCYVKKPYAPR